jgi:uncharacterized protein (DUF2147 family)
MNKNFNISLFLGLLILSPIVSAQDITGVWQSLDDKTGSPKGVVEITKEADGSFTGTITKVTPRVGYKPKEICVDCPAPFTNQPIIGLKAITGLKQVSEFEYTKGKIIDPNTGKLYNLKAKLSSNNKRLQLRGYIGVSAIGRSQTWIRLE